MPLGINIRQGNRSQQALDNSLAQAQLQRGPPVNQPPPPASSSSIAPNNEDKVYEARSSQASLYVNPRVDVPNAYLPANSEERSAYQESADRPARSQSHRVATNYPPLQQLSSTGSPRAAVDDQVLADYGTSYNPGAGTGPNPRPQQAPVEKKNRGRSFFGFNKTNRAAEQPSSAESQSAHNNTQGLGRRISIRQKDLPPVLQSQSQNSSGEKQLPNPGWQSGHSSESQLPSPNEAEEEDISAARYLIHSTDQDRINSQRTGHDHLQNPTIRLGPGDHDSTVRLVDESSWHPQYQQQEPPQIVTQQQWIAQQSQQVANSPVPISPVAHQQNEYQPSVPHPVQYQTYPIPSNPGPPNTQYRSSTNPEVISQISYDSPVEAGDEQRPVSVQSNNPTLAPAANYPTNLQSEYPPRVTSVPGPRQPAQQGAMPPPQAPPGQGRRSTDAKQALQGDPRNNGPPPNYSQQQFPSQNQGPPPGSGNPLPQPPSGQQGAGYRGSALQREYGQTGGTGEQGRSTPPLPGDRDRDLTELDKLVIKYKKVKGLYFDKLAQVEQLQNTLANQRLSQSRTSLDDNEYATRFNRLDGAIKEIAFSIRKDWRDIPRWLIPYVNQDAQKTGTKEMTAVGRAVISRWIYDEIFSKCFHPGLDMGLSSELKRIEQNMRFSASPSTNQEESEILISKVVQWRLSTIEGLGHRLNSTDGHDTKAMFTQMAVSNLTAHLIKHLQEPTPQGIEGNATSIIELAVGIASHLPLESRDISIVYPLPGDPVSPSFKLEGLLLALDNPGVDPSGDADGHSMQSDSKDQNSEVDGKETSGSGGSSKLSKKTQQQQDKVKNSQQPSSQLQAQNSISGKKMSISGGSGGGAGESGQEKSKDRGGDGPQKIRFAGFVGVEVRGRQWLVNPPVWTM